jgi:hypothetical protein
MSAKLIENRPGFPPHRGSLPSKSVANKAQMKLIEELMSKLERVQIEIDALKCEHNPPKVVRDTPKVRDTANIGKKAPVVNKTKKIKLENPCDAEKLDDLEKCTSIILKEYCKKAGLRVSGTKSELMERVWGCLENKIVEEHSKPLKKKTVKREKHQCSCLNKKGNQCAISAFEEVGGKWYCHFHVDKSSDTSSGTDEDDIDE